MSNLVDKEKLLNGLGLLKSQLHVGCQKQIENFIDRTTVGEFDFKPAEGKRPADKREMHVNQIRKVCVGAATGKACPEGTLCEFLKGTIEVPCVPILRSMRDKKTFIIGSQGQVVFDPSSSNFIG